MPSVSVEPSEWVIVVHRRVYVVIRCIEIAGQEYWRVVTGEEVRSQRRLVGYWGTFDEASTNAIAYVEQQLPPAWLATNTATFRSPGKMTPQKPPPEHSSEEPPWRSPRVIPRGVDTVWGDPRRRWRPGR